LESSWQKFLVKMINSRELLVNIIDPEKPVVERSWRNSIASFMKKTAISTVSVIVNGTASRVHCICLRCVPQKSSCTHSDPFAAASSCCRSSSLAGESGMLGKQLPAFASTGGRGRNLMAADDRVPGRRDGTAGMYKGGTAAGQAPTAPLAAPKRGLENLLAIIAESGMREPKTGNLSFENGANLWALT
jgi:hypothetical protein